MTKIRRKKLSCSFQPYPHDQDHPDRVENVEKNMVLFNMMEDEDDTNASSCMTYMYAKHGFFHNNSCMTFMYAKQDETFSTPPLR